MKKTLQSALLVLPLVLASATPGLARDYYGAIAYSPNTHAMGWSYDYATRWEAENRAMAECRSRAGGCRIATWFRNACGAVAYGPRGWGADWGNDRWQAERKATRRCSQHSHSCAPKRWVCTTR
ncbi:MAG: DUF4189 domain-containing protein [Notoacmeibacter sp.]|nr:DUF4189 domain-containing protein [Notoacmeibacter sp.]